MLTMKFFDSLTSKSFHTVKTYTKISHASMVVYKFVEFWRMHNEYRTTFKSLDSLSDRELDDIGLCRGDIEDIAYEMTYGDSK